MKKKIFAGLLAAVMTLSLTACGNNSSGSTEPGQDDNSAGSSETEQGTGSNEDASGEDAHIYVLTASEDHGWTGSVATFAKEKAEEINKDGKYTAEVITSASASEQITKIEDIVAGGEENIAVVIQPMDDTVQSAVQQIIDAGIPYVAFDRIIDAVSSQAVSNVKGDNEGIGAGAAEAADLMETVD